MDAGQIAVREEVRPAIEQPVMSARGHQLKVAPRRFAEARIELRHEHKTGMTAVAGAAAPPAPLVVAGAEAVVPRAIGQHELHVSFHGGDNLLLHRLVVSEQAVKRERGQRLFDVVAHVHRPAALGRHARKRMPFTREKSVGGELAQDFMRQCARAIEVAGFAQDLPTELKSQRRRDRIIHVAGFDGDESVEKFCRRGQAILPLRARGRVENFAVMLERLSQRDRVKHGDALPGAESHVVDPTAVGAAHTGLRPLVHANRRADIFGFARGVRHAQQGIDGVAATAVDERAGGTQQAALEGRVAHFLHLPRQQAIAPGF